MSELKDKSARPTNGLPILGGGLGRRIAVPLIAGPLVMAGFFAGFGYWAATAELDSATIAAGVVAPVGSRKMVQHLEGGIVREILVGNGDHVSAGDPVILLDDTRAKAQAKMLEARVQRFAAMRARVSALLTRSQELKYPNELMLIGRGDAGFNAYLGTQRQLYQSSINAHSGQKSILERQIEQHREQYDGGMKEKHEAQQRIGYLNQEIEAVEGLVDRGFASRSRLLGLRGRLSEAKSSFSRLVTRCASLMEKIAEIELSILNLDAAFDLRLAEELSQLNRQTAEVQQKILALKDTIRRTVLVAPVAGTVVDLAIQTTGGVVAPGQRLMDILPSSGDLVVNARINPLDIDSIHSGLEADVHLLPFTQRFRAPLKGTVIRVSADSIEDARTGAQYFTAEVRVDEMAQSAGQPDLKMSAGMPAEVYIVTGERTMLQYLAEPLVRSIRRGLTDG